MANDGVRSKREFLGVMSKSMGERELDTSVLKMISSFFAGLVLLLVVIYVVNRNKNQIVSSWIRIKKKLVGQRVGPPRYGTQADVVLNVPFGTERVMHTVTQNLSDGGMFLRMNPPLQPGSLFKFHLLLSDTERVIGTAEVIWTSNKWSKKMSTGVGCKFKDLSPEAQNLIRKFIKRRKPPRVS